MRGLRTLTPVRLTDPRQSAGNRRLRRIAFALGLLGVIVEFAISGNTLGDLGVDYAAAGGNLLVKLHPGTYLVALGAFVALFMERPSGAALVRFFRESPALALFMVLTLFCAFYSIANVGFSGAAIYVESYLSAGLLTIALAGGTDRQKRTLAKVIVGFIVISVIISIGEGATQTHLIPMNFGDEATAKSMALEDSDDFRGAGLFSHPLTAAVVTSMATFMLLRMQMNSLLKAGLFTVFLVGLLSFGGRAALATTIILISLATGVVLLRGLVQRNLSTGFLAALGAGLLLLPPLLLVLITSTDIGGRIVSHMYYDDSVDVRNVQWLVLNHLNFHDVLFGVPPDRMDVLKYQIGLAADTTDIENFWLLMFLNLGAMGFLVFLFALGFFVAHLGRLVDHPLGWMLIVAAIMIDSTSNSLGRKSIDLFMMAACLVAMTGYARNAAPQTASFRNRVMVGLRRTPGQASLAGIKS